MTSTELKNNKKVDDDKDESIFSYKLFISIILIGFYLLFVKQMANLLEADAVNDPFKSVWISGPASFSVIYLAIVYFGMKYMKNREPFQIKPYIFAYNFYQCILNAWTVYAMIHEVYTNPWFTGIWGNPPQPLDLSLKGFRIPLLVWIHYNNKYVELLDTLWMILRKKNNQISFLHCYHHVLLIWAWFLVCRIEAGGDCYFGATVNSGIHVIMYGYYTMALLNIPCPWKKWITTCQMIQFVACLSQSIYVVFKGNMPIALPLAQAFVMINMLILFGNFYAKSYGTKEIKEANGKKKI